MKNSILKFGLMAFFALVYTLPIMAQPPDNPGGGSEESDPDPTPIDNWAILLIFAAVAVGTYMLHRRETIKSKENFEI